jgi:class 3 adenylate cyclase
MEVRAGLHAGEVELRGDDVSGIAVNIAARVTEHAAPGEVLVSRTVRDLVVGSGLEFSERGDHELKGVPEQWQCSRRHDRPRERGPRLLAKSVVESWPGTSPTRTIGHAA